MDRPAKNVVVAWRRFLASPEGELGLMYLKAAGPVPFPDEDGKMIFGAGKAAGYAEVFSNIETLLTDDVRPADDVPDRLG